MFPPYATVIVAVAVFVPSSTLVAVIVTVSALVAPTSTVTNPFVSTVAMRSSLEDQVTLVSIAFVTVAVNC